MASFRDITAWKLAHELVLMVYRITDNFPESEKFGLTSQFQRAAVSVPANIAEGYKKISRADKLRFYNIAEASLAETHYYIILSKDINYISTEEYNALVILADNTAAALAGYCKGVMKNDYSTKL